MQSPLSLTDFLFGATLQQNAGGGTDEGNNACPVCRMKLPDFKKNSRLGCQVCYDVFAKELAPMLESMHRGKRHAGKTPRMYGDLFALQARLKEAVAAQRFEDAARVRDEIKMMKSGETTATRGGAGSDN